MNENYKKKKQPDVVRAQLMEAAAEVAVEYGLGGLTLDLVAQKAGVSKGGLIHHYPSRQALVEALFHNLLNIFQKNIEEFIQKDTADNGRFTRAYVKATAVPRNSLPESRLLGAFALAMSHDSELAELWFGWVKSQMAKHREDTSSVIGRMIRYAADGIWLEDCTGGNVHTPEERQAVVDYLVTLTFTL
jgi:AcrR family transcriptional regulator